MKCRIYILALLAAPCSSIFAMDAPPLTLKESSPAVEEMPKQTFLCDEWLAKTPTLSDGQALLAAKISGICDMDKDGFLYMYAADCLMIWQSLPASLVKKDAASIFNALKSATLPTYLGLLPSDVFTEVFEKVAYKGLDPATYRKVVGITIKNCDFSWVRIDRQGHIYQLLKGVGEQSGKRLIEIAKKSNLDDPTTYKYVTSINLDAYWPEDDSHFWFTLVEREGFCYLFTLETNKIGVWKMTEPNNPESYMRIGSFTDTVDPITERLIFFSPSGLFCSSSAAEPGRINRFRVWQLTNPNDPASYKSAFILNAEYPIIIGEDDSLRPCNSSKIWKMAKPNDPKTYVLVKEKTENSSISELDREEFKRLLELTLIGPKGSQQVLFSSIMNVIHTATKKAEVYAAFIKMASARLQNSTEKEK